MTGPAAGSWQRARRVLRLAVPSAGEMLLGMLVGLVNTYLVGHLGSASLTAVGLGVQWSMASMVLFTAVGTGATALTARMIGARDLAGANRVVGQALAIACACGLVASALLIAFAEPAMVLMGARDEALRQGAVYLRIVMVASPISAMMFVGNACMRGAGDTRTPLLVMAVVNVVNISVAWTLVEGVGPIPALGVQGAAWGSTAGRAIGGLLVVALLLKGRAGLRLRWRGPDGDIARRILRVGLPASLDQLIFRLGMLVWVRIVASLGTVAYAAHQIALNGESISFMPGWGFAMAATTLVGQGLGGRDHDRAEKDAMLCFGIAAVFMSLMGVVFFVAAPQIMGLFTEEAEVIAMGSTPLRLIAVVQPLLAAMMVFAGSLRGAGDTLTPMLVNGASVWLLRVPLSLLVTRWLGWGLTGVWLVMALDLTLRGVALYWQFRRGRWKTVEV
ncbi:MAG: MATE family efflux transporter [Candidatus Latescibacteria bacterium]|nr:MATE family efflux transporter [Candidatus Latescibacterota bacterium]MDP7448978.1 MATE family efflux transporter [Candidatus Latescibacterota bacterium]